MDTQPPSESRRPGRARERQKRRRERQQHVTRPGSPRNGPRQIRPTGGFKLPRFKIPGGRTLFYLVGGVLFVILVVAVLGLLRNKPPVEDPNALWIGTEWTYDEPDDEAVLEFSHRLRENRIGTVYAWVSWLKADEVWAGKRDLTNEFGEVKENVRNFVQQFKLVYPDSKLYGWVSVPTDTLGIPARLDDADVQQAISSFSQVVVNDLGFDGVFLNIEQVWDGDSDFLDVLRKVRFTLGTEVPIAVAVPPDWSPLGVDIPVSPSILPGTAWAREYKQNVALLVDQIVVMAYNSGLSTVPDYVEWMAYQVQAFSGAIEELGTDTELLIGIPAYEAEPPAHDPAVENIPSGIQGLKLGLERSGPAASSVKGLAIYASWEMDNTEWTQFKTGWIER